MKEIYKIRVVPLVKKGINKKGHEVLVENLSFDEFNNMSTEPRMLWHIGDEIYLAEMPLSFRENYINERLYFVFDELTVEEQEKYFDRSIIIDLTRDKVVPVYGENSKRLFKQKKK